ncbi:hypothetical protein C3F00_000005 [Pseudomonas sp. MWU13-2860]|nr:hypothetical protein C3F00_000005 [Pseudomonas sp. MWU13-2860]
MMSYTTSWDTIPSSSVSQGLKAMERLFAPKKHGRNDACPCGSGLKYKKCCL